MEIETRSFCFGQRPLAGDPRRAWPECFEPARTHIPPDSGSLSQLATTPWLSGPEYSSP
jgi:hypothetical protein